MPEITFNHEKLMQIREAFTRFSCGGGVKSRTQISTSPLRSPCSLAYPIPDIPLNVYVKHEFWSCIDCFSPKKLLALVNSKIEISLKVMNACMCGFVGTKKVLKTDKIESN